MRLTVYGLHSLVNGKCFYVGSTDDPKTREKAHRNRLPICCREAGISCDWEFRPLSVFDADRRLDGMRAEGYWILRLRHEGHPIVNHTLEGWPLEATKNRKDWWPVVEAWAASKGIVVVDTSAQFLTLTEAAHQSGRSKQYVALCAREGRIAGAVQVQGRWVIPKTFVIDVGEPIMKARQEAVARALALVAGGMTAYAAAKAEKVNVGTLYRHAHKAKPPAKKEGIALSTIYRAIKREKEKAK